MMTMNKTVDNFMNETLVKLYNQCTESQQLLFRRMYSHKNLDASIVEIVENMAHDKKEWAISQCERTLHKA